jgi:hypothetical protein
MVSPELVLPRNWYPLFQSPELRTPHPGNSPELQPAEDAQDKYGVPGTCFGTCSRVCGARPPELALRQRTLSRRPGVRDRGCSMAARRGVHVLLGVALLVQLGCAHKGFRFVDIAPLPPGRVHTTDGRSTELRALRDALEAHCSGARVSLEWCPRRLHVTVRGTTLNRMWDQRDRGSRLRTRLPREFLQLCRGYASPAEELWVSIPQEEGHFVHWRFFWDSLGGEVASSTQAPYKDGSAPFVASPLPLDYFGAAQGYAESVAQLMGALKGIYPVRRFAIAWDRKALQITVHDLLPSTFEEAVSSGDTILISCRRRPHVSRCHWPGRRSAWAQAPVVG